MSNMSYCRFQNTLNDLRDCRDALNDMIDGDPESNCDESLSEDEEQAAMSLVFLCQDMLDILGAACGLDGYMPTLTPKPEELLERVNAKAKRRYAENVSDA